MPTSPAPTPANGVVSLSITRLAPFADNNGVFVSVYKDSTNQLSKLVKVELAEGLQV